MAETSSFEDEILALNPEYDLVFSKYNGNHQRNKNNSPNALEPAQGTQGWTTQHKMKIISKMNEILNAKPIGELPAQHDWDDDQQSAEMETIILMRKIGIEQSYDRAPDEKRTISTVPTSEDVIYMKNGRKKMPIFMGDSHFELKPRSEPSFDFDEASNRTNEESTTSEDVSSDDVNLYQPIFESSQETVSTSLSSEDHPEDRQKYGSREAYNHLNGGVESFQPIKSVESQRRKSFSNNYPQYFGNSSRRSNTSDCSSNKQFNQHSSSRSSSSSNKSSGSWRSSSGSFSDTRDENNWRLNVSKDNNEEPKKPQPTMNSKYNKNTDQKMILNRTITLSKGTSKKHQSTDSDQVSSGGSSSRTQDEAVSSCGRALYKPKDLFMKKKAMMIQQVLAEYQS